MSERPLVAVTGPDRGGRAAWIFTRRAIHRAGGRAVRITATRRPGAARVHALVVGGGADVDPAGYEVDASAPPEPVPSEPGAEVARRILRWRLRLSAPRLPAIDPARDTLELDLLEAARAARLPVLGICRGMQLMNTARGGSLHADTAGFYLEAPRPWTVWPRKRIALADDSRLREILGAGSCRVNALHRQAVDRLGEGLRAVAWEPTGLVQAIEAAEPRFLLGVQWHPEYLPQLAAQRRLFGALVAAARETAAMPLPPAPAG